MLALALLLALVSDPGFGGGSGFGGAEDEAALFEGTKVADQEKLAMRQRLAEDRVRTQFLRREEASILGGLGALDQRIATQKRKSLELLARKQRLLLEVIEVEAAVAEKNALLAKLKATVGKRAAAMHRLRRTQLADLLSRTASAFELRRLGDRLERVVGYDAELVARTRHASADAERALSVFTEEKAALEMAQAELDRERDALIEARDDRAALLEAIVKERAVIERVAGEIAVAAKKLESELDVIHGAQPAPAPAAGGFEAQRGRLPWPIVGKVEVPFGKRVDPDTGVVMTHKGIDVRAKVTEPIRAVFGGKVAYLGTLDGYGRTVILDHEAGWYTVHAHLESSAVANGAAVAANQVIGYVGDSGSIKGPYLYFEIRQGKSAVDPLAWLSK